MKIFAKMLIVNISFVSLLFCQTREFSYLENRSLEGRDPLTYTPNAVNDRISSLLFSKLFALDEHAEIVPDLASSYEKDPNKSYAYILTIKKGLKWSDGKDVTVKDIEFTINFIKSDKTECNANSYLKEFMKSISSVEYLEPYKCRIRFKSNLSLNEMQTVLMFPVLPFEKLEKFGEFRRNNTFSIKPVGCGPFYYDGEIGDYTKLIRNPHFQRNNNNVSPIQSIVEITYTDDVARVHKFLSQAAGMLVEVPWNSITTIQTQHALFQFIPYESLSYDYLGINFRNSLLNIFEVREALSKAINRAQIISTIYSSEGQPISGPWGPQSPYICSQCPPDPYNPGYSRDLLKKAGLVDSDNDGIVEYEGKKVTLRLLFPKSPNGEGDAYLSTCNNFKGAFRAIGIDVDIVGLPPDKFYDKVFIGHDFDLAFHRWRFKDLAGDPSSLFSSSDTAKKMNNYIYYINKDIDELFNRFQMSRDLSTKKELGIQIHKVLAEDRPYIFLWSLKNNTAYNRTQFANININPFDFFYSIYDWQVR